MNEEVMRQLRSRLDLEASARSTAEPGHISESVADAASGVPIPDYTYDSEEERELRRQRRKMVQSKTLWQEVGKDAAVRAQIRESTIANPEATAGVKVQWQDDKEEIKRMFVENVLEYVPTPSDEEGEMSFAVPFGEDLVDEGDDEPMDFASRMHNRHAGRKSNAAYSWASSNLDAAASASVMESHAAPLADLGEPVPEQVAIDLALEDDADDQANMFQSRIRAAAVRMSIRRKSSVSLDPSSVMASGSTAGISERVIEESEHRLGLESASGVIPDSSNSSHENGDAAVISPSTPSATEARFSFSTASIGSQDSIDEGLPPNAATSMQSRHSISILSDAQTSADLRAEVALAAILGPKKLLASASAPLPAEVARSTKTERVSPPTSITSKFRAMSSISSSPMNTAPSEPSPSSSTSTTESRHTSVTSDASMTSPTEPMSPLKSPSSAVSGSTNRKIDEIRRRLANSSSAKSPPPPARATLSPSIENVITKPAEVASPAIVSSQTSADIRAEKVLLAMFKKSQESSLPKTSAKSEITAVSNDIKKQRLTLTLTSVPNDLPNPSSSLVIPASTPSADGDGLSDLGELSPTSGTPDTFSDADLQDDEEARRLEQQVIQASANMKGFLARVKTESAEQRKSLDEKEKRASMSFFAMKQPKLPASKRSSLGGRGDVGESTDDVALDPASSTNKIVYDGQALISPVAVADQLPNPAAARAAALSNAPTYKARISHGTPADFDVDKLANGYDDSPLAERFPSRRATIDATNAHKEEALPRAVQRQSQTNSSKDSSPNRSSLNQSSANSSTAAMSQVAISARGDSVLIFEPESELDDDDDIVAPKMSDKPASLMGTLSGYFRTSTPTSPHFPPLTPPTTSIDPPLQAIRRTDSTSSLNAPRMARKLSNSSLASVMTTESSAEIDLLLARLEAANKQIEADPKAAKAREYQRASVSGIVKEELDWDFWGTLINDFEATVRREPKEVTRRIHAGIPAQIRGLCWQLMAQSKDPELELMYEVLKERNSPHEKLIQADLPRTFPKHEYFREKGGAGQTAIGNVARAYSLYDSDVGYCQGIAFIIGPLLLNMTEQEAFCLLVRLMEDYDIRGHYMQKMSVLHRRLYQFEKLIDYHIPEIGEHFRKQGIRADMYASQWFLTFFAYKCSITLVSRVFDVVFAEGVEAMLRIGIALLKANHMRILRLEFDDLLGFLKTGLFDCYAGPKEAQLLVDAARVRVTMRLLRRYRQEFEAEVSRHERQTSQTEQLRQQNRRLETEIRRLEQHIGHMSTDHAAMTQQLVQARLMNVELKEQVEDAEQLVEELRTALRMERSGHLDSDRDDLIRIANENVKLQVRNNELEEQVVELSDEMVRCKMKLCEAEMERMEWEQERLESRRRANSGSGLNSPLLRTPSK